MPSINVKLVQGAYSVEERQQLITKFTDAVASIKGDGVRPFVTILVEEIESGMWGGGGNFITTDAVREAIAAGNDAAKGGSDG